MLVFLCLLVQQAKIYQYIVDTMSLAPIYWCNFASCTISIGTNMVKIGKSVWTEWCSGVSSTNSDPYRAGGQEQTISNSVRSNVIFLAGLENLPIIIGAANWKRFKKKNCGKQLVAPRLFSWTLSIQWAGVERKRKHLFSRWQPNYGRTSITTMPKKFPVLATFHNPLCSRWYL